MPTAVDIYVHRFHVCVAGRVSHWSVLLCAAELIENRMKNITSLYPTNNTIHIINIKAYNCKFMESSTLVKVTSHHMCENSSSPAKE